MKTLNNTTFIQAKKQIPDLETYGDPNLFKLLIKSSSKKEGWFKSTKAMEIPNSGCLVQVTTQQGEHVAEALTFIPNVLVKETVKDGEVIGRYLETGLRKNGKHE